MITVGARHFHDEEARAAASACAWPYPSRSLVRVLTRRLPAPLPQVTALTLALALAGCAGTAPSSHPASRPAVHRASGRAGPGLAASQAASPVASSPNITLAFAGDVNFAGRTARLLADPATAFGPISSVLGSADLTMVNLETAVTTKGVPQPKTYHFRTTGTAFTAIRAAGIDLVTMANNHVLDYGQVGLAHTLAAAKAARFPYVGIGVNARAAWAPYLTTIKGTRIAIIGVSQVAELASSWVATGTRPGEANSINVRRTLAAVRAARKLARVVIVFMHWGTEGQACPDPEQLALAPRLAAAGASIIIGAHAHMLQGSGWLGHTFVAYGMGNFLWWEHSYSTATGVLRLTLGPGGPLTAAFVPAVVSSTGRPVADHGARARRAKARYARLRSCTGLSARPPS
jgi:poly-gamma-glutamate capsule biosynthesis protein CapA/YwtB (metallophosphatase superfamily)